MNGLIKKIKPENSFGFIIGEDKVEYFFHKSDFNGFWEDLIMDYNKHGYIRVEFDSVPSAKGPRAGNVRRTDWPNRAV